MSFFAKLAIAKNDAETTNPLPAIHDVLIEKIRLENGKSSLSFQIFHTTNILFSIAFNLFHEDEITKDNWASHLVLAMEEERDSFEFEDCTDIEICDHFGLLDFKVYGKDVDFYIFTQCVASVPHVGQFLRSVEVPDLKIFRQPSFMRATKVFIRWNCLFAGCYDTNGEFAAGYFGMFDYPINFEYRAAYYLEQKTATEIFNSRVNYKTFTYPDDTNMLRLSELGGFKYISDPKLEVMIHVAGGVKCLYEFVYQLLDTDQLLIGDLGLRIKVGLKDLLLTSYMHSMKEYEFESRMLSSLMTVRNSIEQLRTALYHIQASGINIDNPIHR